MYLPRSLIATLYTHLSRTQHSLSPPVLILCALEPDALAGCRILTSLLKRDYIPHKITPVSGYHDLENAGKNVVRPMMESEGGSGGVVICLGVGGLIDLGALLGIDGEAHEGEAAFSGVEVWVIDARRPWNLANVFGGMPTTLDVNGVAVPQQIYGVERARLGKNYRSGKGGVIVFDDGDIEEELGAEKESYLALVDMPEVDDDGLEDVDSDSEDEDMAGVNDPQPGQKRKSWSDREEEQSSDEDIDDRPRQRRRSNSSSPIPDSPSRPAQRGLLSMNGASGIHSSDLHSMSPTPGQGPRQPSERTLRKRLIRLKRKHEAVLRSYYSLGTSYSEPISSMMYSLASELGREDNDLLWLTIVGVSSMELYGRSSNGVAIHQKSTSKTHPSGWLGLRGAQLRQLLRDEVRRLNPPELSELTFNANRASAENSIIPTTARSPTDKSIRLSPEPKFLLIRHWSLWESMLHSPYLSARLRVWTDNGKGRLAKLLAKMGFSKTQYKENYVHMDIDLKKILRPRLLKYAEMFGFEDLIPPALDANRSVGDREGWGFVRSWGYRATLSAQDVGVVVGAILEVGKKAVTTSEHNGWDRGREIKELADEDGTLEGEEWIARFWDAYDALDNVEALKTAIPIAQHLHRAILATGTSIIEKKQLRHLRAFRMCVVKDGPYVSLFNHPAALTKLALWIGEAIAEQERDSKGKLGFGGRGTPLVVAGLNESRGVYVVVGTGGGGGGRGMAFSDPAAAKARKDKRDAKQKAKEAKRAARKKLKDEKRAAKRVHTNNEGNGEEDDDEDDETESEGSSSEEEEDEDDSDVDDEKAQARGYGRNRFGNAFAEVVEETAARIKIDSFEHCVVEVKKEDLAGFLEQLSQKAVIG